MGPILIAVDYSAFRAMISSLPGASTLMSVRHEMFFIGVRRDSVGQVIHCAFALLRDVWWSIWYLRRVGMTDRSPEYVFLASLAGTSGWQTLRSEWERRHNEGCRCALYVHPRLRRMADARLPMRPPMRVFIEALWAALRTPSPPSGFHRVALSLLLFRAALWTGIWRETIRADQLADACFMVHNDFDMFLRPAVSVAQDAGISTICVQHGLPTAEFFPLHAHNQMVWSARMAEVYRMNSDNDFVIESLEDRPSLPVRLGGKQIDPVVRFVSQTHTVIYGRELPDALMMLAAQIGRCLGQKAFRVLLHPAEGGHALLWRAYAPDVILEHAPHASFAPSETDIRIFIGFSSTALIDAAVSGHIVISVDLPHSDSLAARDILRMPFVTPPHDLAALVGQLLADPAMCEARLAAQDQWLQSDIGFKR